MRLYELCGADPDIRFSPHCWKARLALAHKGLAFEGRPVPFTAIGDIDGGGHKRVPVLDDDGVITRDSFQIARYLDAHHPERPLFAPESAAIVRLVEAVGAPAYAVITRMIVKDIHDLLAPADQAYFRESRERRLGAKLEEAQEGIEALADDLAQAYRPVRLALKESDFLGGGTPLFVDYVAAAPLLWLHFVAGRIPFDPAEGVGAWFARIGDLHGGEVDRAPTGAAA